MANRIKGITVEIGGDTAKLSKALEGVNKNIKNTQTQLKDVQKLLKLDPSNTELLSQKHKLLADAVKATKEMLETLKTAAEQANQALRGGDISQEQYDALQREIIETEQELQNLQREAEASSTALAKLGQAGEMLEKAGDKIADVGTTLTTHVTVPVMAAGTAAVKTAADFDSAMSKVAAVSGAAGDSRYVIDLTSYQDESLSRYVGIAIYLDTTESVRSVSLRLFPGTPAENPSLPSIPQDEDHVRLLMYAVRMNPGASRITESDWFDYREDSNVCGYCKCILGKCKVTELMAQMAQLIAEVQENNETIAELTHQVETLQTEVDDIIGGIVEIGTCGDNIHYVLYENGKLLLHGSGATYDYEIGHSPFWENENIRSLVVSDGITEIGSSVFERCVNMASASFPNTLTAIGERAFFMYTHGGLTELAIPASVTTLGEKAFVDQDITSVTLPATLTTLGTYIFMGCNQLTSARVECSELPGFCFVSCGRLQSLTLSRNVTKVCSHALNYTPLRTLTYEGSLADWAAVTKQTNWDGNAGDLNGLDKVQCLDGYMEYNDETREWVEVRD